MPDSILASLYFSGGSFALLFTALLMKRAYPDRRSNRFLAGFIAILGITLFDQYGLITGDYVNLSLLVGLAWPFTALLMPVLYLYAYTLTTRIPLRGYQYGHFALFVLYVIVLVPFYASPSANKLTIIYGDLPYGYQLWQVPFLSMFMSVQTIVYTILSFRIIRKHNQQLELSLSDTSGINLNWIKTLFLGFLLALLVSTFSSLGPDAFDTSQMVMHLIFTGLLFYLGYRALKQHSSEEPIAIAPKYETSKLDEGISDAIAEHLKKVMSEQKPWQKDNLKLEDLALLGGVKSHLLSQVLSTRCNQNFYEFVNSYRINDYCLQIEKDSTLSTTDLVFRVGFNSRTAFYRAFRRLKRMTPTEWRKSLEQST